MSIPDEAKCNAWWCVQVADLHGVVSKAQGFNKELKATASKFLSLRVRPETGQWVKDRRRERRRNGGRRMTEADVNPPFAGVQSSPSGMQIRPPGVQVQLELAGIEVLPSTSLLQSLQELMVEASMPGDIGTMNEGNWVAWHYLKRSGWKEKEEDNIN